MKIPRMKPILKLPIFNLEKYRECRKYLIVCNAQCTDGFSDNIGYWQQKMGYDCHTEYCRSCRKRKFDSSNYLVGGHVIDVFTGYYYIVPICTHCNTQKKELPPFSVCECDLVKVPAQQVAIINQRCQQQGIDIEKYLKQKKREYFRRLKSPY